MGDSVQQGTCKSLRAKDLGPLFKWQIGSHHEAMVLIGSANDLKEQLRAGLGKGDISQFIQDEHMEPL